MWSTTRPATEAALHLATGPAVACFPQVVGKRSEKRSEDDSSDSDDKTCEDFSLDTRGGYMTSKASLCVSNFRR
jgi:hypothetical protein